MKKTKKSSDRSCLRNFVFILQKNWFTNLKSRRIIISVKIKFEKVNDRYFRFPVTQFQYGWGSGMRSLLQGIGSSFHNFVWILDNSDFPIGMDGFQSSTNTDERTQKEKKRGKRRGRENERKVIYFWVAKGLSCLTRQ